MQLDLGAAKYRNKIAVSGCDLQQSPTLSSHIRPPADELLPLLRRGAKDSEVGNAIPICRVGLRHSVRIRVVDQTRCCGNHTTQGVWEPGGGWRSRKPSSVQASKTPGRSSIWDGDHPPPLAAYPRLKRPGSGLAAYLALLRLGVTVPRLLPGRAVGSYPTFSPLPAQKTGGLFSVALTVALRRPGVTWQSTLWSSDFPRPENLEPRPSRPTTVSKT